ncbi:hypothetical protein ACQEU8_19215 [Streptomyces sp. CA-250714]|uniref:hypothetical protein n=1 Tax=Streptomyces sp. CA-250714 TaxID=3240060 RepID=UPI003D8ABE5C
MMRDRVRCPAGLALVTALGCLTGVPSAQAEDEPRPSDATLLAKCDNGTKSCTFHPSGPPEEFTGKRRRVGDLVHNCTEDPQTSSMSWEDKTGESNSMGVSLKEEFERKFPFGPVFKVAFEQSFKKTWASEHSETQTTFLNVPPDEVGWVVRSPRLQKVKGMYELIFEDKFHGRRYWYVPFTATGPVPDNPSSKTQRTRAMTADERSKVCE